MERHRWLALDGLRAIAVLGVLCFHFGAPYGTGGYLGVDVFFVLSGCVVTASFRRSMQSGGTVSGFLWRRGARIFPNLVALSVAAIAWDWWRDRALLTAHNAAVLEGVAQIYDFVLTLNAATPHLWSLSVEWQIYCVLPIVLAILCSRGVRPALGRVFRFVATALALKPALAWFGASLLWMYFWPFSRLDEFALGVAVALALEEGRVVTRQWPGVLAGSALLLAMVVAPRWWKEAWESLFVVMPLAAAAAAVVVWSVVSTPDSLLARVLSHRWLRAIGDRSYSIYLWHYMLGVGLIAGLTPPAQGWDGPAGEGWRGDGVFAIQMLLTLAVASLAYALIERPARDFATRWWDARHRRVPLPAQVSAGSVTVR